MTDHEQLIKALRVDPFEVESEGLAKVMNAAADAIEALQAQLPKRGEWIEDEYGYTHCSLCKMEWDEPEHPNTNYCPNCGAKMIGEQNVE